MKPTQILNYLNENYHNSTATIDIIKNIKRSLKDNKTIIYESELSKEKYKHYLVIRCINNKPITKHRILTEMIANKHYQHKQHKNYGHKYLEGFYSYDGVLFNCNWGS